MTDWIHIASDDLKAAINPLGAELSSLRDAGDRELMTNADPKFWTGRAPLLFPIVGAVADDTIHVDGVAYPMPKHGFARHMTFDVVEHAADRAVFALADNAETRAHYPFAFRLEIAFTLAAATLDIAVTITNPGDGPLPASFGFHPAFAWPLPYGRDRADHRIVFERDEGDLRRLTPDSLIAPGLRASPLQGRTLHLADDLFTDDALIWAPVASQAVRYGAADGPQLDVAFPDTPDLGIWTKPGAAYVCIEPWHGHADLAPMPSANVDIATAGGNFAAKPGAFVLPSGAQKHIKLRLSLVA